MDETTTVQDVLGVLKDKRKEAENETNKNYKRGLKDAYTEAILALLEVTE